MQAWKAMVQSCPFQTHLSRSLDPFVNLSVENFLLQNSHPQSTVLFLYVNRPCVVIGRNQNPWLEVDLKRLSTSAEKVQLLRRRSGGGSVFHDEGNVNYCVICPAANFTRDKHAEMVTRVIRLQNERARVNERHDIVLDQGSLLEESEWPAADDMHRTMFHPNGKESPPLKVSGSAYKMIRQRCLHHGTCLLTSPGLHNISQYLRSPSQSYIRARGVDSVRSSIGNVFAEHRNPSQRYIKKRIAHFEREVIRAFGEQYQIGLSDFPMAQRNAVRDGDVHVDGDGKWLSSCVGGRLADIDEIQEGITELRSSKWLYGQTPQFTLSSHSHEEDPSARPPLPDYFPPSARVYLKVRSGAIEYSRISISSEEDSACVERELFDQVLRGKTIHDIEDFNTVLNQVEDGALTEVSSVSRWLNTMLGKTS